MRALKDISDFIDEIEDKHNIPKRISEIQLILDSFIQIYSRDYDVEISLIDDAAVKISYFYYYKMELEVKNYLDENSNIFKMSSGTELAINYVQPISDSSSDSKGLRILNAELSLFSALGFLSGWNDIDYYLGSGIEPLNDSLDTLLNERLKILSHQNIDSYLPILFNSQSWELFHLIHQYFRSAAMIRWI